MPSNDYNLVIIKSGIFIFSFCLTFTVNALFFTDETMHKIYENKGIFDILYQLPSIVYSNLITIVLNMLIKTIALSEKMVLKFKTKYNNISKEKLVELYNSLICKFNIFFCISSVLLLLFWYYIATFCAVYKNTQIALIKNTISSFSFTLIYPFVISLFPGIFRMFALKSREKNKECLYVFGNILSLI